MMKIVVTWDDAGGRSRCMDQRDVDDADDSGVLRNVAQMVKGDSANDWLAAALVAGHDDADRILADVGIALCGSLEAMREKGMNLPGSNATLASFGEFLESLGSNYCEVVAGEIAEFIEKAPETSHNP